MIKGFEKSVFRLIEYFPKSNINNQCPALGDLQTNHLASFPYQTMFIMAGLSDGKDATINQLSNYSQSVNEYVLCCIDSYSNGTVILESDFNNDNVSYVLETRSLHSDFFYYCLEHASTVIALHDLMKERRLFNDIFTRQHRH